MCMNVRMCVQVYACAHACMCMHVCMGVNMGMYKIVLVYHVVSYIRHVIVYQLQVQCAQCRCIYHMLYCINKA